MANRQLCKIPQLDLMLDTHVRDGHLDDIESLGDSSNPFVATDRCEPLGHGLVQRGRRVTSTVRVSWMVTRHERTDMTGK